MGEAKRKAAAPRLPASVVYHHTSTLRTNQLWMSGHLKPEGTMPPVLHPQLGELKTDARARRAMKDFPPVLWFTRQIRVPNVLQTVQLQFVRDEGVVGSMPTSRDIANAIALNRFAIGFPVDAIGAVSWPEHPGYATPEGQELNDTAREAGDDPRDWYVTAEPVDLLLASEVWFSKTKMSPRLERQDWYLPDMKAMVRKCRANPAVYIPPAWLSQDQAMKLARSMGLPVGSLDP